MIDISVILCCYNSAHLLKETLCHLAKQVTKKDFLYEVVLVDNNSTDQTAQIAKQLWLLLETDVALHVVSERQPGLSWARKTGVLNSNGDLIVFCDDDNWLEAHYLQLAYNFMIKNSRVGALGGEAQGVLEMERPPSWWQVEKSNYAVGKQAEESGDISKRGYLWGAGIVMRKELLVRLYQTGFISLLSDRKGNELSSGGDSEFCKWIQLMGFKLWYLESLKFSHYITKNRLVDTYLVKLLEGHQQSQNILNLYNLFVKSVSTRKLLSFTRIERLIILKKVIKAFLKKDKRWKIDLQLVCGAAVKIHPDLYQIIITYKYLTK
ncbi:glycosyltransferase [Lacinutrix jangbogonensis]|uniref:glycosyltransferase n=1 Tax=Lacinutrix jangbogonensis TaxID=1469557 RepID=UPI00068E741D|nr:glycosyltransferase [Lacinutrix jangbogonensis]